MLKLEGTADESKAREPPGPAAGSGSSGRVLRTTFPAGSSGPRFGRVLRTTFQFSVLSHLDMLPSHPVRGNTLNAAGMGPETTLEARFPEN